MTVTTQVMTAISTSRHFQCSLAAGIHSGQHLNRLCFTLSALCCNRLVLRQLLSRPSLSARGEFHVEILNEFIESVRHYLLPVHEVAHGALCDSTLKSNSVSGFIQFIEVTPNVV